MVYVIGDGSGYVKIGVAQDVDKRMFDLQTGNPRELQVLFAFSTSGTREISDLDLEHLLHKYYDKMRVVNNTKVTEWFDDECCKTIEETVKHILGSDKAGSFINGYSIYDCSSFKTNKETIGKLKGELSAKEKYIHRLRAEVLNKRRQEKELSKTINDLKQRIDELEIKIYKSKRYAPISTKDLIDYLEVDKKFRSVEIRDYLDELINVIKKSVEMAS